MKKAAIDVKWLQMQRNFIHESPLSKAFLFVRELPYSVLFLKI